MHTSKNIVNLTLLTLSLIATSCNKLIEIPESRSQIETAIIFNDSTTASAAVLGAYFTLRIANEQTKHLALYSDEYIFTTTGVPEIQFFNSQVLPDNNVNASLWNGLYSTIYQCNTILEETEKANGLSAKARQQFKGEAKFLRAFAYFYLLNLWDNIPLILGTDVDLNAKANQSNSTAVYDQIVKDLQEAKADLSNNYIGAGKVRANSLAATALLARVFLYQGKFSDAEREASTVINSGLYSPLPKPEDVFLANSKEAILQFWTVNGFLSDAATFIPASASVTPPYVITTSLIESFASTDPRKTKWIGVNNHPGKYKNRVANTAKPEYIMVLRLAEQYLIRAEALANQNKTFEAMQDVNLIRSRAGTSVLD
ncbi:MAG: RagB/SusD family nutrient uptake outer membrane protein, partial [Pedobacter sp.]